MTRSVEFVPVPTARTQREIKDLLQIYATTPLPVLAICGVRAETVYKAVEQLEPLLPKGMNTVAETRDFEFGANGSLGLLGLHRDYYSPRPDVTTLPITYHLTTRGYGNAYFMRVGPQFMERHVAAQSTSDVSRSLGEMFATGVIDDEIASPTCYRSTTEPNKLHIFKNGLPLWHLFDGDEERLSTAFDSSMAITPGMDVQYYDGPLPSYENSWGEPLPPAAI